MTLWEADIWKWLIPFTLMDPLTEIYGFHIELRKSNGELTVLTQNIQRKLQLIRYKFISHDGSMTSTIWVFPYYEVTFQWEEEIYSITYNYQSYTPKYGENFIISQ